MTWTNPILLAGLAAAVLPVVLHLLGRAHARPVAWGAMSLVRGEHFDATAGRLRQRVLLAVRVLAVAALAVAFARPTYTAAVDEPETAVVLVVDASPGMTYPQENQTRFELARDAARAVVRRLSEKGPGNQAGLIVLGGAQSADVPVTPDLQAIVSQLATLSPGVSPADLGDGERRARTMLADAGVDNGEIVLIADRQYSAWASLRQVSPEAGVNARVTAVPVGSTEFRNAWIESLELIDPPAVVGVPTRVAVTVRNVGDVPQGGLTLAVSDGRSEPQRGPVAVAANGRTRVVRTITPDRGGSAVMLATIDPTGLPGDDTARTAIDVIDPPKVRLMLAGGPTTQAATTRAAVPRWAAGDGVFDATVLNDASDLTGVDAVVISDFTPDAVTVAGVERYVAAGGSLLLTPGPDVTPAAWNGRLWKNGFGFAPAAVAPNVPPAAAVPTDVAPFLAPGPSSRDWTLAAVTQYWKFSPGNNEITRAAVDGAPLVIERAFGRGRVITLAVPPDGRWARGGPDLYAGLTGALVRRLVDRRPSRNVEVGVPLEAAFGAARERWAVVIRPNAQFDRVPVTVANEQALFRYARTDLPGRYVVRVGTRDVLDWAVHADASESNARMIDDRELTDLLRPTDARLQAATRPAWTGPDWTGVGLVGVGVLLAVDLLLAGGRGGRA